MTTKQELVKVCVDYVRNPQQVLQFSEGKDFDTQLREKFFTVLGVEKVNRKTMRNTANRELVFEILTEVITESFLKGVEEDQFFMQFADIRNVDRGDLNEFYLEDDAILTVSQHSGNHWNIRRQKLEGGTKFTVETKAYAIGVYADFEAFMTGRVSFARLVGKIAQALKLKVYEEVAATFASTSSQLPAQFVATGTYAETKLIDLYQHVQAVSGNSPIVVGTAKGLATITNGVSVNWISDDMKNEKNTTGRIGIYNGMTLVQLPVVHKSNTFEFAYDDKQILVLPTTGDQFIKVVYEGDDYMKQTENEKENNDMSFEYLYSTRFGTKTVFSSLFGIYTLA